VIPVLGAFKTFAVLLARKRYGLYKAKGLQIIIVVLKLALTFISINPSYVNPFLSCGKSKGLIENKASFCIQGISRKSKRSNNFRKPLNFKWPNMAAFPAKTHFG
jgi:hypothetical protein